MQQSSLQTVLKSSKNKSRGLCSDLKVTDAKKTIEGNSEKSGKILSRV